MVLLYGRTYIPVLVIHVVIHVVIGGLLPTPVPTHTASATRARTAVTHHTIKYNRKQYKWWYYGCTIDVEDI